MGLAVVPGRVDLEVVVGVVGGSVIMVGLAMGMAVGVVATWDASEVTCDATEMK